MKGFKVVYLNGMNEPTSVFVKSTEYHFRYDNEIIIFYNEEGEVSLVIPVSRLVVIKKSGD